MKSPRKVLQLLVVEILSLPQRIVVLYKLLIVRFQRLPLLVHLVLQCVVVVVEEEGEREEDVKGEGSEMQARLPMRGVLPILICTAVHSQPVNWMAVNSSTLGLKTADT